MSEECVLKAAKTVRKVKLSEQDEEGDGATTGGKRMNINDVGGDILIIPQVRGQLFKSKGRKCFTNMILQATLGGKLKGNSVQYHNNIKPTEGDQYYRLFCDNLSQNCDSGGSVQTGVWGARQVVSMETNGPFSHTFDI